MHTPPPDPDPEFDDTEAPPPVYEVEEELVERRINPDGQFVQIVDGKEVVIERRRRSNG